MDQEDQLCTFKVSNADRGLASWNCIRAKNGGRTFKVTGQPQKTSQNVAVQHGIITLLIAFSRLGKGINPWGSSGTYQVQLALQSAGVTLA